MNETTTIQKLSLYERLGKREGITSLVDDIVEAHMNNPVVKPRFEPYRNQADNLKLIKAHTVDFFCAGTGGLEQYTGRDMLAAHKGMNISEEEFIAVLDDILQVLDQHGIDADSRKDVLAIAYSLKDNIIRV
ncbi:hemoglobin [Pontibacter ummariensis]|uniref:Hemoglobin n=1 Tax=Pontibacter ummariensis TaxID=1610492 RepID=A0A239F4J9_9BACT|nr:group 1 truncated hemoglobin [Pontibacter ummariensis]PRY12431.1 hemoglobin [Pontibacter ummariensis]SNS51836.1 hemoglobin [Pontibacter ummariensis]